MATSDPNRSRNDALLGKADAFIARRRGATSVQPPDPALDYPILTEVVESTPEPPHRDAGNIALEEIEKELRVELLGEMTAEIERLIEARVHARLSASIDGIMTRVRAELFTELRRAVHEALKEVLDQQLKGTKPDASGAQPTRRSDLPYPPRMDRNDW
jgi:hypothetical protein